MLIENQNYRIYSAVTEELNIREGGQVWKKRQQEELIYLKDHGIVMAFREVASAMIHHTELVIDLSKPTSRKMRPSSIGLYWNFISKDSSCPLGINNCNYAICCTHREQDQIKGLRFNGYDEILEANPTLIKSRLVESIRQPLTCERDVNLRLLLRITASSLGWI